MKATTRDGEGATDTDSGTETAAQSPKSPSRDVATQLREAVASDNTLLPTRVANLVSFATRSTGLAIRIGSAIGGYGLGAAKVTTLSSLALSRAMLEGIFTRAGKDAISRSNSDLARADSETILERTIEGLHRTMGQIVFWTAASFQTTSTTLSMVSETSQLLLSTIDQFFGSTDSSRAMASIITMVRREFQNPATGMQGEIVSVSDLVMVLCGIAYLQRSCRSFLEEETRTFRTEEIVWDVVVPSDGMAGVSREEKPPVRRNSVVTAIQAYGASESHHDDNLPALDLEREIMKSLPHNAKVSITREIATSEIIRVNVISDAHPLRLEPPPGVELVEENWDLCVGQGEAYGSRGTCSQFVFRREHRQERRSSFQKVDGDISHAAGHVEELGPDSWRVVRDEDTSPQWKRGRLQGTGLGLDSPTPGTSPAPTPTMRSRAPTPSRELESQEVLRLPLTHSSIPDDEPSVLAQRQLLSESGFSASEKRSGLRNVLKKSMSIFNKDASSDAAAGKNTGSLAVTSQCGTPRLAPSRSAPSTPRIGAPSSGEETPGRNPFTRSTSYITVHESLRQSTISLTESFSMTSADDYRPVSFYEEGRITPVAEDPLSDRQLESPRAAKRHHQRVKSHTPSIYTLRANRSETSLVSYHAYHATSAFSAAEALGTLRQEGMLNGMFPKQHLLRNITRYMRFASASYGSRFLKLLGIATQLPIPGISDDTHHELRSFAHHTRSDPSCILLSSFVDPNGGSDGTGATNTGVPLVHYITLDHASRAVVLSCRGTLGFEDVLADMACEYDDLVWRGTAYKVHKGIHASARRLLYGGDGRVLYTLKAALEEFPDYGLVLTGHSLGGAVTALLGVMLSDPPGRPNAPFVTAAEPRTNLLLPSPSTLNNPPNPNHSQISLPPSRPIHVYAYGPPATMSPALRTATAGLVTTVVHGNDLVPFLSLGVLHDLQAVALALKSDNNAAKAEVRGRIWRAVLNGVGIPGTGANNDIKDGDEEWAYATLKVLRASMVGEKLVPPGEVFVVECDARVMRREVGVVQQQARLGKRVVLRYVGDVERRFREVRFGRGMLTHHSPGRYEEALEGLIAGVLGE